MIPRVFGSILIVFLAFEGLIWAQLSGNRIQHIEVEGNRHIETQAIVGQLSLHSASFRLAGAGGRRWLSPARSPCHEGPLSILPSVRPPRQLMLPPRAASPVAQVRTAFLHGPLLPEAAGACGRSLPGLVAWPCALPNGYGTRGEAATPTRMFIPWWFPARP